MDEPKVVGKEWVITNESGGYIWWDYVRVYSNGDIGEYEVGYRDDGNKWQVAYNYINTDGSCPFDAFLPKTDYPTHHSLREMLKMEYLLTRGSDES